MPKLSDLLQDKQQPRRIRRPEWSHPDDHVELTLIPNPWGGPGHGLWVTLHSPTFVGHPDTEMKKLAVQKLLFIDLIRMWGEDGWEIYIPQEDGHAETGSGNKS